MTDNKHWIYLEKLRRSGIMNMYGAAPYLAKEFNLTRQEALDILVDWMKNYRQADYEGMSYGCKVNGVS